MQRALRVAVPRTCVASSSSSAMVLVPVRLFAKAGSKGAKPKTSTKAKGTAVNKDLHPGYELREAIRLVKAFSRANFDETVDLAINTSADPRKPNQTVRGVAKLPHGSGQKVVVAVFAKGGKAEEARKAGADIVGAEDLGEQVAAGKIDFNRCIATPDMMPIVAKLGKVLGPRGLMPNPKLGTVTMDVTSAIKDAKQGQVEFRCEKQGIVQAAVGKVSFSPDALVENTLAFTQQLDAARPAGAKGTFLMNAFMSSTMGPGIRLNLNLPPFKAAPVAAAPIVS